MSDILARIQVKETHGIRRFLYPLNTVVELPTGVDPHRVSLVDSAGQGIPTQITPRHADNHRYHRLDFAVFLAPLETLDLTLYADADPVEVKDPLHVREEDGLFRSRQERFFVDFGWNSAIERVAYDGISHLRGPSKIALNNSEATLRADRSTAFAGGQPLCARVEAKAEYTSGHSALTTLETTACKSWVSVMHRLDQPKDGDEVVFTLPMNVTSPTRTCDFGVGGGIYSKLPASEDVVLDVAFNNPPFGHWTLATGGRTDQQGDIVPSDSTTSSYGWLLWPWFHVIDSDKAIAVAITGIPFYCCQMTVTLAANGEIRIAFTLGNRLKSLLSRSVGKMLKPPEPVTFGVCYHFLNDVPAIAAATNPQSILLPPRVEVL